MLVLSRRAGESIRISDDIVVSVQRVAGNRIIIGIEAPKDVSIRRGELVIEGDAEEVAPAAESRPVAKPARPTRRRDAAGSRSEAERGRGLGPVLASRQVSGWSTANMS